MSFPSPSTSSSSSPDPSLARSGDQTPRAPHPAPPTHDVLPFRDDLHVHLYGCLSALDLFELGRDLWRERTARLEWYAAEYEKATGRRPDWRSYWTSSHGAELLARDYEIKGPVTFEAFQAVFNLSIALLPIATDPAVDSTKACDQMVLQRVLERDSRLGLRHVEYRVSLPPHLLTDDGKVVRAYLVRTARAARAMGRDSLVAHSSGQGCGPFEPRIIVSLARDPQIFARQYHLVRAAQEDPDVARMVVGLDLSQAEEGWDAAGFREPLALWAQDNQKNPERALGLSIHVGETFASISLASSVRRVVQAFELGARRLGHALALGIAPPSPGSPPSWGTGMTESIRSRRTHLQWLLTRSGWLRDYGFVVRTRDCQRELETLAHGSDDDPRPAPVSVDDPEETLAFQDAMMRYLAEQGAIIECCPTSNRCIAGLSATRPHPIGRFIAAGLKITVGRDDPGIFDCSLETERDHLRSWGVSDRDLAQMAATSADFRFARPSQVRSGD